MVWAAAANLSSASASTNGRCKAISQATMHVVPLTANAKQPAHQADDGLTGFVIEEVPTERLE